MALEKEPVLLFLATAGGAAACFIPVNYIPIYFIFTRGDSGIEAAVRLLPYIFVLSFTILINGALLGKLGYYKPWCISGAPLLLIGGVLMCKFLSRILTNSAACAQLTNRSTHRYQYIDRIHLWLRSPARSRCWCIRSIWLRHHPSSGSTGRDGEWNHVHRKWTLGSHIFSCAADVD